MTVRRIFSWGILAVLVVLGVLAYLNWEDVERGWNQVLRDFRDWF